MRLLSLTPVLVTAAMLAGCGGGDDGSFTLVIDGAFYKTPVSGTFTVSEGSDDLGCSSGTFVDTPVRQSVRGTLPTIVRNVLTCTDGDRRGSFVTRFPTSRRFWLSASAASTEPGVTHWRFEGGTDDFTGIEGSGDLSLKIDGDNFAGIATLTGNVAF